MKRSEFLKITLVAAGAHVLGCGDDDGGSDAGGTDAGRMDSGGDDAGGDDAGGDDAGGDDAGGDDAGGDDAGGDDAGEDVCIGDTISADVSNNHGHELVIPLADIMAGEEKDYVTGGTTTHCHIVTLTAADFATLRSGGEVRVVSCNNTEHEYALSCAGGVTANDPEPTCDGSDEGGFPSGSCTGDTFTP